MIKNRKCRAPKNARITNALEKQVLDISGYSKIFRGFKIFCKIFDERRTFG